MARKKTKKKIYISVFTVIAALGFLALTGYLLHLKFTNQFDSLFNSEGDIISNPLLILCFAPIGICGLYAIIEKLARGLISIIFFLVMGFANVIYDNAMISIILFIVYFIACFILCVNMTLNGANDRYYESPFDRNITFSNSYSTPDYLSSGYVPYDYSSSSSSSDSYTSSSSDYSDSYGSSYSGYTDSYGTSRPLTFQEKCDYTDHLCGGLYTYGGIEKIENDPYLTPEQKEDLKRHYMIYGD